MFTGIMELFSRIAHLVTTLVRVALPGGVRTVIAESLLLKHQLIVLNRARNRASRLTPWDRLLFGIGAFWVGITVRQASGCDRVRGLAYPKGPSAKACEYAVG
jgi:hypothetical protein